MDSLIEAREALAQRGHEADTFGAMPVRTMYWRPVPALWTTAPPGEVAALLPLAMSERCGSGWAYF